MKELRPILIIMGGVRLIGGVKYEKRHRSKDIRSTGKKMKAMDIYVRQRQLIEDKESWKAARRFIVNTQKGLHKIAHRIPWGLIVLESDEPKLYEFRESIDEELALLNSENSPACQVADELSWTLLGKEAQSRLLTLVGDRLPSKFWQEKKIVAVEILGADGERASS